ncbi:MAG: hypothetical protein AB7N76_07260 [Planctomycetota bacterium]
MGPLKPELELPEPRRLGEVVGELQALLALLRRARGVERQRVYARCVPLLGEAQALSVRPACRRAAPGGRQHDASEVVQRSSTSASANEPSGDVREVKALVHEAGWHLRSLAGLTGGDMHGVEEHAAWAEQSLDALARCAAGAS